MKIVLASALFPPDIAPPAPYVKELAVRLSQTHEVTAVVYSHSPEPVAGVRIIAIDKRTSLVERLWLYYRTLARAARDADIIFVENGPSVELPALFVRGTILLHRGDRAALKKHRLLTVLLARRATHTLDASPQERPEILPFQEYPAEAMKAWEESWQKHLAELESLFNGVHR